MTCIDPAAAMRNTRPLPSRPVRTRERCRRPRAQPLTVPIASPSANDRARLLDLIHGYRTTCIVAAALDLGVLDALAGAPARPVDLARGLGVDGDALARLLRGMAALGLVSLRPAEVALTALGRTLADPEAGVRERALLASREYVPAWQALAQAVATGATGFERAFGMSAWEHRQRHPEHNAWLNATMADDQRRAAGAIPAAYDFSACRRIVDVGGGEGALLAEILAAYPQPKAVLLDQPHVVAGAAARLAAAGVAHRCEVVGGSFFDPLPRDGDAYLLQHVLHNWSDERAGAILRRCREAIAPQGALLAIENVVPDDGAAGTHVAMLDLHMMVMLGGRERTRDEFAALLAGAGFALQRSLPATAAVEILVARPA